jgi:hypothetical protein
VLGLVVVDLVPVPDRVGMGAIVLVSVHVDVLAGAGGRT